jgi:hypothetical protein
MRLLILVHRYLGIAVGVFMVAWCASGAVMMYVGYPELDERVRLAHLEPIDWNQCCHLASGALDTGDRLADARIEMLAGRPTLEIRGDRQWKLVDLVSGAPLPRISVATAEAVARGYRQPRTAGFSSSALIDFDQWTVSGDFSADRPLFRVALGDEHGTVLYVSSQTGRAVQLTTANQRFWNWLGAIPHWLYFSELRHHPAPWRVIVISSSLVGTFLALLGLYIGAHQLVRHPNGGWSTHHGVKLWHHGAGLLFGILALTWVLSGLLSMNPWGLLEGGDDSRERAAMHSLAEPTPSIESAVAKLAASRPAAVSVTTSPLGGRFYWIASTDGGERLRYDESGDPKPLTTAELLAAAGPIGAVDSIDLLDTEDDYFFAHPPNDLPFPVYRLVLRDLGRTRYYVDSVSGETLAKIDAGAKQYRWWHDALHRGDFAAIARRRPFWDLMMLVLLAGVSAVCATGVWLAFRHLRRRGTITAS